MPEVYLRIFKPLPGMTRGLPYFGWCPDNQAARLARMYRGALRKRRRRGYLKLSVMERNLVKWGPGAFDTVVIERDDDVAHCRQLEAWHQGTFDTLWPRGLNSCVIASGGGRLSDAVNAKISVAMKLAYAKPEVRAKLRASLKAAHARPEVRAKLRAAMTRPEVRAKIRAKHSAAMKRPEVRAKIRAKLRAAWLRPEVRAKHSGDNNCMKRPEYRAKHRAALARPEYRAKRNAAIKAAMTPEVRAKHGAIMRAKNPNPSPRARKSRARSDARRVLRTVRTLGERQHLLRDQLTPRVLAALKAIPFRDFRWPVPDAVTP